MDVVTRSIEHYSLSVLLACRCFKYHWRAALIIPRVVNALAARTHYVGGVPWSSTVAEISTAPDI